MEVFIQGHQDIEGLGHSGSIIREIIFLLNVKVK